MRVGIVTESFLPTLNGVTTSVCRVAEQLRDRGHEVVIVAPDPAATSWRGIQVVPTPSVSVRQFPAGVPTPILRRCLERFAPDVLHVASPFVLGARALHWADREGVPSVAIYQTDMPSYLAQQGPGPVGAGAARMAWRWIRHLHDLADLTLAPSSATLAELRAHAIPRTAHWGRGVDLAAFHPGLRAATEVAALRSRLAPAGEVVVGYVGRLAPEKELWRLAELATLDGLALVVVGDGPGRGEVEAFLSRAWARAGALRAPIFLGALTGDDLSRAYAALDVFVHTGTRETFGQTLQEAAAAGLPVVAPARGGPLDLVEPERTGLLFDPDRPGALQEAVTGLVADPDRRASMGARGARAVAGRTWPALTEQLLDHYGHAIRVHRERRRPLPRPQAA